VIQTQKTSYKEVKIHQFARVVGKGVYHY